MITIKDKSKAVTKKVAKKTAAVLKTIIFSLKGRFGRKVVHRPLEPLIEPIPIDILQENIKKMTLIYHSDTGRSNIGVYMAQGFLIPDMMLEIGRLREKVFRTVNEGTGKSCDIDEFDPFYHHMIAYDEVSNKVLGAYRIGLVDKILQSRGPEGLYSYTLFKYDALLKTHFIDGVELGRSFVDDEAGRAALRALDCIWKGLGCFFAENPRYRYMVGPVSISNSYTTSSKLLMIYFLKKNFKSELSPFVKARVPVKLKAENSEELKDLANKFQNFSELDEWVKKFDGTVVPSLLKSYSKMHAKYLSFNFDPDFNTIDGMIMVDMVNAPKEEIIKHMGEASYAKYLAHYNSAQTPH
ncbi:MAG: GNAT family N-acetyltransferase [Bdellovibrionaceae bacterium]|nr:GNAT family N-acetyltransferase [Pseudobdellovibrionaceae bacterium]